MCYFPLDAATNYHKLCGLKQHKFISCIAGGQKSEMGVIGLTLRSLQGCVTFWWL